MGNKFSGYELSNGWFEFLKNNASKVNTNHSALYMYIIHKANKLGWPDEFGLPSEHSMHASGFNNYKSYKRTLDELIEFGVIELITEAKNQHTATVIALVKMTEATTKAVPKQSIGSDQSSSKAEPTYINELNCLNNKPLKPLATVKTENLLETVDDIIQWFSSNGYSLGTNNPQFIVGDKWYQNKSYKEKKLYLQDLANDIQLQTN